MTAAQLADRLPAIGVVRRWSQSLAVLDAVMSAEREYRYYSFDAQFRPGQARASMDNGSGDEYSITFTGDGAFLRGFDHESPLSPFGQTPLALWPGLLTGLPAPLAALAREPAFTLEGVPMVTVAFSGNFGTRQFDGRSESYLQYASEYFERQLPADAVMAIMEHRTLTAALVRALNPERSHDELTGDLNRIGYPAE